MIEPREYRDTFRGAGYSSLEKTEHDTYCDAPPSRIEPKMSRLLAAKNKIRSGYSTPLHERFKSRESVDFHNQLPSARLCELGGRQESDGTR